MELFGYELKKLTKDVKKGQTFAPPRHDDGAIQIETNETGVNFAGSLGYVFDLDNVPTSEFELITTYRDLSIMPDIDEAIQEIVNEAIITDEMKQSVSIILDDVEVSDVIKDKIRDEFDHILRLLKFRSNGYGIFRKWYIDGKLLYHKVFDSKNISKGIVDLVELEPLNTKLVRELKKTRDGSIEVYDLSNVEEYFIYSPQSFGANTKDSHNTTASSQGLKINRESVVFVPSGLVSSDAKIVLSYLYKAIKPYNNLRMMEDSVVIYRVTRAPERRIFYVDVGNLPKGKADQYLKDVMNRFRNKIVYDVAKGTINNRKKFQSMMEDYWFPRREGGKATEVTTLPGGQNLGELDDVEYFKVKLQKALNVPLSRFQQDGAGFNLGRTSEITRDEIKFSKFISRLRKKFSVLFDDILKTQLLVKKIITPEEWDEWKELISYDFLEDNYFQELKEAEILRDRLETLEVIQRTEIIGKYISHDTVRRDVLKQSEDTIKDEDKKIGEEEKDDRWNDEFGADEEEPGQFGQPPAEPQPQPVTIVDPDKEKKPDQKEKPLNTKQAAPKTPTNKPKE